MTVNISQLAPFIWILAAVLVVIVVFVIFRFFWRHVLKFLVQAGLVILVIFALLALLRTFKVF
jgi:hypothetical protein